MTTNKDEWALFYTDGRILIGRIGAGCITNALELLVIRQMSPEGMHMVVQCCPIAGMTGSVTIDFPFDCPMSLISKLEPQDQEYILKLVEQCIEGIRRIRAERTGVVIASSIPQVLRNQ